MENRTAICLASELPTPYSPVGISARQIPRHASSGVCSNPDEAFMRWALISAPLLGTGEGGVPHVPAVEALTVGFRNQAPSDATLSLCVLHKAVFKRLEARFSRSFVVRA